jgi:hypothetical protein
MVGLLAGMITSRVLSWFGSRKSLSLLANINKDDLAIMGDPSLLEGYTGH